MFLFACLWYRELESQALEPMKATVTSFDKRHFNTKYYVSLVTDVHLRRTHNRNSLYWVVIIIAVLAVSTFIISYVYTFIK